MSKLSKHEQKRMKKTIKALTYWRSKVMTGLHGMNQIRIHHESEKRIKQAREAVKKSKKTIKHIDYLIGVACLMLKIDMLELEAVPIVRIKTYKPKPFKPPKPKNPRKGEATYDFTVRP